VDSKHDLSELFCEVPLYEMFATFQAYP
jgi:hypothetical protein